MRAPQSLLTISTILLVATQNTIKLPPETAAAGTVRMRAHIAKLLRSLCSGA